MKKTLFSLLALVALHAQATVLVVKEYGVNATYSTINAALTAAANNDTIVVYDKPSGQQWIEALTINKNLTFLHPTQGTRFKAPGQITIVPQAGMDLYFIGWDLNGVNSITATATGSTATAANRAKITITDCINVQSINLNVDWLDARVFYNQTNFNANITIKHGLVVANVIGGGIQITGESSTVAQADSIIISGNKARWCSFDSYESGLIANNYFYNNSANSSDWWSPGTGNALHIRYHNQSNSRITWVVNNTITNIGALTNLTRMAMSIRYAGNTNNIRIINNLFYADDANNNTYGIWGDATGPNANTGNPYISHNFINTRGTAAYTSFSENNELNYKSAASNAYGAIDTWGRAASGNANLINKGNYLGQFYDIDLTRNDIGTYGGPFSIDNYLTGGVSKGRGLFIDIPHQLTNLNQIINAKAAAGSKF